MNKVKRKKLYEEDQNKWAKYTTFGYTSQFGRSYLFIVCPFCQIETKAYIWSLKGGGKCCPGCGGLHGSNGHTIPVKVQLNPKKI